MKFLLHGNAPTVPTGYGVQMAQLAQQLRAAGHEVAISATYGQQGAVGSWKGIRVYPCGYEVNSNDLIDRHAEHFFDGDEGWIITLIDVWAMVTPRLKDYNVAAWCPVDHWPAPPAVLKFFSDSEAVPVAMSKFGQTMFQTAGLDAAFVPLSVDTSVYRPTPTVEINGVPTTGRTLLGEGKLTDDSFVVGMVAMNKGWARDRKGFNEALWAMGLFMQKHDDAYLYLHTEKFGGAEGQNLVPLYIQAGIPEHRIIWSGGPDQYAFRLGFTPQMMALTYSMFDVLLAPSHGEGFCVPMIEAQACGTPVIATDCTAQSELIDQGWKVDWQPEWDPAHNSAYAMPLISSLVGALEDAYSADREAMAPKAVKFAQQYDTQAVFEKYWVPFIESLEAPGQKLSVPREPMPEENAVAVLCPVLNRPENVAPLVESFLANTPAGEATLMFIVEPDDAAELDALSEIQGSDGVWIVGAGDAHTFAEKLNVGFNYTTKPWVLCIGDDVRFHEGWLDQARKLSSEYDVIGTNDALPGQVKNPLVAKGAHADHFFVRRAYVDEHGACLEGPGVLAPEVYRHWYVDKEIISLAKARGVFTPCLDSIVEHLHPGYDGREDLRQADSTYMAAVEHAGEDEQTFKDRVPLIEMQRTTRAKIR